MGRLLTDLHIHSNFSDGAHSISEIVDIYGSRGFDTIAITDHIAETKNIVGRVTHGINLSLSESKFGEYLFEIKKEKKRALEQYDMNVLFGYEITKNHFAHDRSCHFLVIGLEEFISPDLPAEDAIRYAKQKDALVIAAHPFHTGSFEFQSFYLWSRREQLKDLIDAWEMSHRKNVSHEVMRSGLPMVATSDFHQMPHLNSWKTVLYGENSFAGVKNSLKHQYMDFYFYEES